MTQSEIANVAAACRLAGFRYVSFTPPSFEAAPTAGKTAPNVFDASPPANNTLPATEAAPPPAMQPPRSLPEPLAIAVTAVPPQPIPPAPAMAPRHLPQALPVPEIAFALLGEIAPVAPSLPPAPTGKARKPGAFALLAASMSTHQDR